jgi:hypothetical protein
MIIGAKHFNSDQGKAYIFHRSGTTWTQQAGLTDTGGLAGDWFGQSVSISGNYAVVGAPYKNNTGEIFIYYFNGTSWALQANEAGNSGGDWFGYSVSSSGNAVIAGACNADSQKGKAYIYSRSGTTWSVQATLQTPDAVESDRFGKSVSISGYNAVVSTEAKAFGRGKAYIFHYNDASWKLQAGLLASDGSAGDNFGRSVSITPNYTVVGAPNIKYGDNSYQGEVYFFKRQ